MNIEKVFAIISLGVAFILLGPFIYHHVGKRENESRWSLYGIVFALFLAIILSLVEKGNDISIEDLIFEEDALFRKLLLSNELIDFIELRFISEHFLFNRIHSLEHEVAIEQVSAQHYKDFYNVNTNRNRFVRFDYRRQHGNT